MNETAWLVDLAYGPVAREFRHRHRPGHPRYRDGLEMLFAQGVRAFELWTGLAPSMEHVRGIMYGES